MKHTSPVSPVSDATPHLHTINRDRLNWTLFWIGSWMDLTGPDHWIGCWIAVGVGGHRVAISEVLVGVGILACGLSSRVEGFYKLCLLPHGPALSLYKV
jgi:hypothetical protein